jgi:hypothetical protein
VWSDSVLLWPPQLAVFSYTGLLVPSAGQVPLLQAHFYLASLCTAGSFLRLHTSLLLADFPHPYLEQSATSSSLNIVPRCSTAYLRSLASGSLSSWHNICPQFYFWVPHTGLAWHGGALMPSLGVLGIKRVNVLVSACLDLIIFFTFFSSEVSIARVGSRYYSFFHIHVYFTCYLCRLHFTQRHPSVFVF